MDNDCALHTIVVDALLQSLQPQGQAVRQTFTSFVGLADIVRVNGEPAKGTWGEGMTAFTTGPRDNARAFAICLE